MPILIVCEACRERFRLLDKPPLIVVAVVVVVVVVVVVDRRVGKGVGGGGGGGKVGACGKEDGTETNCSSLPRQVVAALNIAYEMYYLEQNSLVD
jgi:hypothetical protein